MTKKGEGMGDMGLFEGGDIGTSRDVRGVAERTVLREERDSRGDFGECGVRMAAGSSITVSLTS